MRLIDTDKLKGFLHELGCVNKYGDINTSVNELNNIIGVCTVDPVKHGRWMESNCLDECFWVCSECEYASEAIGAPLLYHYCPNCGALMDREDDIDGAKRSRNLSVDIRRS